MIERLWTYRDASTLAAAEADFRARGPAWAAVANALVPEHGDRVRRNVKRNSAGARLPAFTLG